MNSKKKMSKTTSQTIWNVIHKGQDSKLQFKSFEESILKIDLLCSTHG